MSRLMDRSLPTFCRVFTVFSTSKDHRQGERAMAGCILVDNEKIQVINRSPKYKNKYVHRRTSVALENLTPSEVRGKSSVLLLSLLFFYFFSCYLLLLIASLLFFFYLFFGIDLIEWWLDWREEKIRSSQIQFGHGRYDTTGQWSQREWRVQWRIRCSCSKQRRLWRCLSRSRQ